jgi:hypothetical protein
LVLLDCEILEFFYQPKSADEIARERAKFSGAVAQQDFFARPIRPYAPAEYSFKYRYRSEDGIRTGTCQDWEMDTTYFNWRRRYSETDALAQMHRIFGIEYPKKGMALAMGTHSQYPDTWLINGVIRINRTPQLSLL